MKLNTIENKGVADDQHQVRQKCAKIVSSIVFEVEGPNKQYFETMIKRIKLNDCGGDISKRWYVDYIEFSPDTKKPLRKRAYGYINKEKDPDKRYLALIKLRDEIIDQVRQSYQLNNTVIIEDFKPGYSLGYFINLYLNEKQKTLKSNSFRSYNSTLTDFVKFLKEEKLYIGKPGNVTVKHVELFISKYCRKNSQRTINNKIDKLKLFFDFVIKTNNALISTNPITIKKVNSRSEKHVAYTTEQAEKISNYLKETDVDLLNFCRFVGYGFIRPNEILSLKIKNIDFAKRTIVIDASASKTGKRVHKAIMQVFYEHLKSMNLEELNPDFYIFGKKGRPGIKPCSEYLFRKRFKKIKSKFNLSRNHTIYGFRHTFVAELLNNGAEWQEIMKYTGHTSMDAFQKYARSIFNKPAKDLSNYVGIRF